MMQYRLIFFLALVTLKLSTFGQSNIEKDTIGEKWARQELKSALNDTIERNMLKYLFTILDTKEKAVKFAEQILFDKFGKQDIELQKPYSVYFIEDYWIINGSMPTGMKGGTFLIIINSRDCQVIKLNHGK